MEYKVILEYPTITVTVEADNEDDAVELAVEIANDDFFGASEWISANVK